MFFEIQPRNMHVRLQIIWLDKVFPLGFLLTLARLISILFEFSTEFLLGCFVPPFDL